MEPPPFVYTAGWACSLVGMFLIAQSEFSLVNALALGCCTIIGGFAFVRCQENS